MFRAQNAAGEHKTDTASKITADSSRHSAWLAPRPIPNLYRTQLLEPLQAVRDLGYNATTAALTGFSPTGISVNSGAGL
jgi:hypothetical protein